MTIKVEIKNVYGVDRIYPIDKNAKFFTSMTGNKTLSQTDIETIKALGFTIEVQAPEL